MPRTTYPFAPRSAVKLKPGEFWSIPLKDGSFACGRVIQGAATYAGASRLLFLAGLLDWRASIEPTAESIAGAKCIAQGKLHVKSIRETGGAIIGYRDLHLDELSPNEFRSGLVDPPDQVLLGHEPIRPQRKTDHNLPTLSLWGYLFPKAFAEHNLLDSK